MVEYIGKTDDSPEMLWDLGNSLIIGLAPYQGGKWMITFYRALATGEHEAITEGETRNKDFYNSDRIRSSLANTVSDKSAVKKDAVKGALDGLAPILRDAHEFDEEDVLTPDAKMLLRTTEKVRAYIGGDGVETVVWMHPPDTYDNGEVMADGGPLKELRFSESEWMGDSKIAIKYYGTFAEEISLEKDDWDELRAFWKDMKVKENSSAPSERDIIAENVMTHLRNRVPSNVVPSREYIMDGDYNAHYEETATKYGNNDVLWVRSKALQEAIDEVSDKSKIGYLSELSQQLKEDEITLDGSVRTRINGANQTLYPFKPDTLGVTRDDVTDPESDDDLDNFEVEA